MNEYQQLRFMFTEEDRYKQRAGQSISYTLNKYSALAGALGFSVIAIGASCLTDLVLQQYVPGFQDVPKYTVDSLVAIFAGAQVVDLSSKIGYNLGLRKVKIVLDE